MRGWIIALIVGSLLVVGLVFYLILNSATISIRINVPEMPIQEESFADWHTYTSSTGNFTVLFPLLPQHVTHSVTDPKTGDVRNYEMDVATRPDGSVYTIIEATYPNPTWENAEQDLKKVVDELFKDNVYKYVTNMAMSPFKNINALNFNISNEEVKVEGKAFIYENSIYILSAVAPTATYNKQEFEFFFNSFDFTPQNKPQPNPTIEP